MGIKKKTKFYFFGLVLITNLNYIFIIIEYDFFEAIRIFIFMRNLKMHLLKFKY